MYKRRGPTGEVIESFCSRYLFFARSQQKKSIFHWEARLISSLFLFQVQVHNFRSRCWKIQNSRVSTGPDSFSKPAFIMVFFRITRVGRYVHVIILHLTLLTAPMGKMKRILSATWLAGWTR